MSESITFQVDLEWTCLLARTWLWDEDKPLEVCINLLLDVMSGTDMDRDTLEQLAVEILEGRKIIRGINEGFLYDDGELIRPLSLYIKKQRRKLDIIAMKEAMERNPRLYLDTCVGGPSSAPEFVKEMTLTELIDWRTRYRMVSPLLEEGLYLIFDPEFALDLLGEPIQPSRDSDRNVIDALTKHWNDIIKQWESEGMRSGNMTDYQKEVLRRQLNASVYYHNKYREKTYCDSVIRHRDEREDLAYLPEWVIDASVLSYKDPNDIAAEIIKNPIDEREDGGSFEISLPQSKPKDLSPKELQKGWDGYIDREGKFYPTKPSGVGWYRGSAFHHEEWARDYIDAHNIDHQHLSGKDYLIYDLGWISITTSSLDRDDISFFYRMHEHLEPDVTKEQKESLFRIYQMNEWNMEDYFKHMGAD